MHERECVDQYDVERCEGNEDEEDRSVNELTKPRAYGPITYWTMNRGEESTRSDPETMRGREWAKACRGRVTKVDSDHAVREMNTSEVQIPEC